MSIRFFDPTHESAASAFKAAPRVTTLKGATVAIISNGKKNTIPFFDAVEKEFKDRYDVAEVVRLTKYNYSAPVEAELLQEAGNWQALISGIGD
jgi:hypothetical protein